MGISYQKCFDLMKERGLTTYKIRKDKIISEGTLTNMRAGKSITVETIETLCRVLQCQPGDLMEYVPDTPQDAAQGV